MTTAVGSFGPSKILGSFYISYKEEERSLREMMLVQSEHKTQIKLKYGHNTWIGASPLLLIHVFIYRPDWL